MRAQHESCSKEQALHPQPRPHPTRWAQKGDTHLISLTKRGHDGNEDEEFAKFRPLTFTGGAMTRSRTVLFCPSALYLSLSRLDHRTLCLCLSHSLSPII